MDKPRSGSRKPLSADSAARLSRACSDVTEAAGLLGPDASHALARLRDPDVSDRDVDLVVAEVEEILRAHGLVGSGAVPRGGASYSSPAPPGSAYQPLPGLGGGRPIEEVHVCPGNLCDRVELPRPGAAIAPTCAVWACPMPLFRMNR
ncbi:hypothetical protein [Saccharomonospora glauca]|jgi:hypothetical protein|uniref:Uncharacterized protein n=1 Tax=Saccharomonospora glauca K62 TaxID=928724 RepID=I1D1N3_9PSEU|nr:hypothetical protein [Saccharomonospora glauca]EIE98857.1 hypothetical protein SacglDRAFT_01948 [Saccharomonospora glauca K62]